MSEMKVKAIAHLFHPDVSFEFIARVFNVMAAARCEQHTFQVLTKRIERVQEFLDWVENNQPGGTPLSIALEVHGAVPNVLLGPSIENQSACNERLPHAARLAGMGWRTMISLEPLLGPIEFSESDDAWWESDSVPAWVIVGGESGPDARPMHPDWARSVRDQCQANGVPFFFKQWGAWLPMNQFSEEPQFAKLADHRPMRRIELDNTTWSYRVGKKKAGRLLDGREWNEMPVEFVELAGGVME